MKKINPRQWQTMLALKLGMKKERWVPMDLLNSFLNKPVFQSTLDTLHFSFGFVEKTQMGKESTGAWGPQIRLMNHYRLTEKGNEYLIKKLKGNVDE